MRRFLLNLVSLLILAALCAQVLASRAKLQRAEEARTLLERRLTLLQGDSDRMRTALRRYDLEAAKQKSAAWREKIETAVEEIRGLQFKNRVDYDVVTKKEIVEVLSRKLAEVYTEEDFQHIAASLARFGVLPVGYPLRQKYVELLGEQVAAFYDQKSHKLFMFAEATLDDDQNRVVLAHELTHALQDQVFGLQKMPLEIKDNDDRALAASSLVEGEATVVMSAYMMQNLSLKSLKSSLGGALKQDAQKLGAAPRALREGLLFPYLRGQEFCAYLTREQGLSALDAAYQRRPESTAEILHPERYEKGWKPVAVDWPETTFDGEPATLTNVMGEASLRIQLSAGAPGGMEDAKTELAHQALAAEWMGDRYLYFAREDALVWKSVWRTAKAAAEFIEVQRKVRASMRQQDAGERARDGYLVVSPTPETVLVIDAKDAKTAEELRARFGG